MLSRTASCLFWMARYLERAENLARLLDVSHQLALMPAAGEGVLAMPLDIIDCRPEFAARGQALSAESVACFLILDPDFPSSITAALRQARENAHVVRGTITGELWEAINATWLEARQLDRQRLLKAGFTQTLEWVKERTHLARGVIIGSSQRNDAFHFTRLGTHLERADNTVRLLRHHLEAFSAPDETGQPSYYAWAALLRSLSAFESYRDLYSDSLTVPNIGELLLLRGDLPRSVLACVAKVEASLTEINGAHGRAVRGQVASLHARLRFGAWADDFADDPVAVLDALLEELAALGDGVRQAYWSEA